MAKDLTTDELVKARAITEFDLQLALDAAEADPDIEMVELGAGYALNLPAALRASSFAELALAKPNATPMLKRAAVRTAILLARPVKV
jgi:hypothetical protein